MRNHLLPANRDSDFNIQAKEDVTDLLKRKGGRNLNELNPSGR